MTSVLLGTLNLIIYFVVFVAVILACRLMLVIPDEVFRKILHFVLLGSLLVFVVSYPTWQITALAAIIFELLVYPVLAGLERLKGFSKVMTERKTGEIKNSLMLVYTMFAVVVAVCWGVFDDKYLTMASLYAWGIGDAFAALIGKKYGKHKIKGFKLDGKKSFEGTFAMFAVSFMTVWLILAVRGGLDAVSVVIVSALVAAVSAVSELYSKNGNDTVICPIAAMAALIPLLWLCGGL